MTVVVIGGSISGLMFAKHLGLLGTQCIVLEKEKEVGTKACGELIKNHYSATPRSSSFSNMYGSERGVERHFKEVKLVYNGKETIIKIDTTTLNRKEVEKELLRQARKIGANVMFGEQVTSLERTRSGIKVVPQNIVADVVVGADGFHSITREFMGVRKPEAGLAITTEIDLHEKIPCVFFEKNFPGYCWIFPKRKTCNIGVGSFYPGRNDLKKKLTSFLSGRGLKAGEISGAFVPVSAPRRCYGKNTLLVGDSASQISSLSGGGITSSSYCAKFAAEAVNTAVQREDFSTKALKRYETLCKRRIYPWLWLDKILLNLLTKVIIKNDFLLEVTRRLVA